MVRFTGSVGVGLGWFESLFAWCSAAVYPGLFPSVVALVAPSGVRYLNRYEGTIRHESGGFWLTGALASSTCSVTVAACHSLLAEKVICGSVLAWVS